jgi:hypothetical protein
MPIAQIMITPPAAVAEEHAPNLLSNLQDIKAAAAATDPNLSYDHDGVQHHDDQTA